MLFRSFVISAILGFGLFGPEIDHILANVRPTQRLNRTFAPASEEAEAREVLEVFWQVLCYRFEICGFKEALPFVADFGQFQRRRAPR